MMWGKYSYEMLPSRCRTILNTFDAKKSYGTHEAVDKFDYGLNTVIMVTWNILLKQAQHM